MDDAFRYAQENLGEKTVWSVAPPEGRLVVHDDRVFRAVAVSEPFGGDGRGLWHWTLRPDRRSGADEHFEGDEERYWRVLPSHYALCVECQEPVPCRRLREQWAATHATRKARALMAIPEGVCWGCREVISSRQAYVTFPRREPVPARRAARRLPHRPLRVPALRDGVPGEVGRRHGL